MEHLDPEFDAEYAAELKRLKLEKAREKARRDFAEKEAELKRAKLEKARIEALMKAREKAKREYAEREAELKRTKAELMKARLEKARNAMQKEWTKVKLEDYIEDQNPLD